MTTTPTSATAEQKRLVSPRAMASLFSPNQARVCNSMGMSHREAQATRRVVERVKQLAICLSRRPLVLVGAVAYMVSRYNKGLKVCSGAVCAIHKK